MGVPQPLPEVQRPPEPVAGLGGLPLSGVEAASVLGVVGAAGGGYDLPWSVLGGGGGSLGNGGITLDGTVGQPVVGQVSASSYALCTGFWCGAAGEYRVYLPVVLREA